MVPVVPNADEPASAIDPALAGPTAGLPRHGQTPQRAAQHPTEALGGNRCACHGRIEIVGRRGRLTASRPNLQAGR